MLSLLKAGAGAAPYGAWLPISEALGRSKSEKLELYLKLLYDLLRDLTLLGEANPAIRNADLRAELTALSARVSRQWLIHAVKKVDEIAALLSRNIQKQIALDGLLMQLRRPA
jgi:DNA polymerase-3 subunit delta'